MSENQLTVYKSLALADGRRRMAGNPAVLAVLDTTEKTLFSASTGKMVAEYNDTELVAELTKSLRTVFRDVGYRAEAGDGDYIALRLTMVLRRYYGQLTMQEFRLAFEMSVVGELDEYLPKGRDGQADRGHYQQFSVEYVCKILNAYRAKRDRVLRKAEQAMPSQGATSQEIDDAKRATRRDLVAAYRFFCDNGRLPSLSPIAEMLYYNLLVEAGFAPKVEVTEEEKSEILRRSINDYLARGYTGDAAELKEQGTGAPSIQYDAFALARRKALRDTFSRMAKEGIQITDYIKI